MLMSASSEFVALCQEQMALLAHSLGASLSVLYLTQELVETSTNEAKLIPVVVYPETASQLSRANVALPNLNPLLLTAAKELPGEYTENSDTTPGHAQEEYQLGGNQIVLPLIREEMMMGLLVTGREDRAWNEIERREIERVAQTLALGCILDQRRAWLHSQLHQQQIITEKQQDLLDNLLHQFRNPLTALRTFGKLLVKRLRPQDANREVAASIVRESDRLQELLQKFDEVIDLTPTELEQLTLPQNEVFVAMAQDQPKVPLLLPGTGEKQTECSLVEILEPLLVSARAIASEQNLQLIAQIKSNLPKVRVNAKALREVLSNIIDNALKYTPAGGRILIQLGQEKANFQGIAISDTGPGIPPQDLAHVGERRYRGVQAQTEIPGTGLGLAIAKQLIEQMQGEIQVFSPAISKLMTSPDAPGTTFIIWLPIAQLTVN